MLFAKNKDKLGQLITSPMVNLARASTTLAKQSKQACDIGGQRDYAGFMAHASGRANVAQQVVDHRTNTIAANRKKLRSIIKCLLFCGKKSCFKGKSLRKFSATSSDTETNPGNILALLKFRIDAGDTALGTSFLLQGRGPRNVIYCSPQIQNDLWECIGGLAQDTLLESVRAASFFSLCADEACS